MSADVSERRLPAAPTALFLVTIAAACWALTVDRMQGMNMGPATDLGGLGWFATVWVTMMTYCPGSRSAYSRTRSFKERARSSLASSGGTWRASTSPAV
jgi:hypothetical protein